MPVNIGEMMIVLITHTDVIDRETFLISNGFQLIKDDGILAARLFSIISAIFILSLLNAWRAIPLWILFHLTLLSNKHTFKLSENLF